MRGAGTAVRAAEGRTVPARPCHRPGSEAAAHLRIALGQALNAFCRWRGATDPPPDTGSAKAPARRSERQV